MFTYKHQAGLSLLELMVAMVIISVLVLGITEMYIDNRQSYMFQQGQSENQENNRFALLFLHQELTKAGYRRVPDQVFETDTSGTKLDDYCPPFTGDTSIIWNKDTKSLCIRYQPSDHKDRDCLGNLPETADDIQAIIENASTPTPYEDTGEVIFERFYIALSDNTEDESVTLKDYALRCQVFHKVVGKTVDKDKTPPSGEIITGLVDLRFEFGVSKDLHNITAYHLDSNEDITDTIIAVRYTLLTRSSNQNVTNENKALDKWREAVGITEEDEKFIALKESDKYRQLYHFSQGSITLRNIIKDEK